MTDFEKNGVVVSDEDDNDTEPTIVMDDSVKDEKNASNNSSSHKNEYATKALKSKKSLSTKRRSFQSQTERRSAILDKMKGKRYVYDDRTQAFLSYLFRPPSDVRDVKSKSFKNQLMLSENMIEIPTSFAKNWLMVVCPVGSRCLVVASKGYTGAYTKTGYHIISHSSSLPMGSKILQGYGCCVLDCIYCNETETYYVLDIMVWDGRTYYDCDVQARFRLVHDKIREYDLSRPSHVNPYPFVPLKSFTPAKKNIIGAVTMAPYMVEGLLFYHKQGNYTPGPSPLVLWITLDRLPTKLKIEIPEMGIVTSVSYKDPVALALAHGVSPAIISQVYPSGKSNLPGSQRWIQNNKRPGHSHNGDLQMPSRHFQESNVTVPPFPHEYHGSYSFPENPHRFNQQRQMRGSPRAMPSAPGFDYLSDMMMGLNLHPGNQGAYGQYNQGMMMPGAAAYGNYNMNNNYSDTYFRGGQGGSDRFPPQRFIPHKGQKKRMNAKSPKNGSQGEQKSANWDEPHGVMKSQWMESKPENFEEEYFTCVCPMAKRRIIVAANGTTCTYNKYGSLVSTLTSSLPSGCPGGEKERDLTILDCLWCGSYQKFYVIDVMHWRQQPFYDSEAECRFFWLTDKLSDVKLRSGKKEYSLEVLPKCSSNKESILAALENADYKVDGLLCIQKSSYYTREAGAKALWLKLDMMEELLEYPAPNNVSYKASTEKERKQRAYFIHLKSGKGEGSNSEGEEEVASGGQKQDLFL